MAEDHELTVYIEVPVKVHFSTHPAEKATETYPGCEASLNVDFCQIDDVSFDCDSVDIDTYMQHQHGDYIYQQCIDSVEELTGGKCPSGEAGGIV